MIHNRYLPVWLHRVCCGVLGAAVLAGLGSIWLEQPSGDWRHFVSRCLLWGSVPAGIVLACIAHRFSIVEGLAGGEGYDELQQSNENKTPDYNPLKKRFTIAGAVSGLVFGAGLVSFVFVKGPGWPGMYELLLLAVMVGIFSCAGALAGLVVGWLISYCIRRN